MYQVVVEKQAQKQLAKFSPPDYNKIVTVLKELATNPRPFGYKNLKFALIIVYGQVIIALSTRLKTMSLLFLFSL